MKEEALIMTIDFGKNHFNAIYLNNQLKLISPDGSIITINNPHVKAHQERKNISTDLLDFFKTDAP